MKPALRILIPVLLLPLTMAANASDAASSQPAKWVTRAVDFTYQGIGTFYSCDGLRDNTEAILRALGAQWRKGEIRETACAARGEAQISPYPGVRGTMSVLVPATAEEVGRHDPQIVAAHWQSVNLLGLNGQDGRHGAQCELLEQVKRGLLPLFSTRNLEFKSDCAPRTALLGNMTFKVEVLKLDSKPAVQ